MITSLYDPAVERVFDVTPTEITTPSGITQYPFRSPEDWRDVWIYFLLIDRFNNPEGPPVSSDPGFGQYQGGTFEGIRQKLGYLKDLGVGALWLSPVLMNPQWFKDFWGGYCIMDFLHVDPRFCKDPDKALKNPEVANDEFRSLVDEIHANGMCVILDIVLNHTANLFNYEGMRDAAPYNADREYQVYWRDHNGVPQGDRQDIGSIPNLSHEEGVWPSELQRNDYFRRRGDTFEGSPTPVLGDFGSLKEWVTEYKEVNTELYPVRNALIRIYQYLIGRFDLDGFRIDTLKYVEPDFARIFGNAMREYALSIGKKNFLTFGEVADSDNDAAIAAYVGKQAGQTGDIMGVDAALDFPMQKRLAAFAKAQEAPAELANYFDWRKQVWDGNISSHGDASRFYITFLDNHDGHSRITAPGWEAQTRLALTCLMTTQGIPTIYYGTELGLSDSGDRCEYVRQALWGQAGAFSETGPLFELIQELDALRRKTPALRYGRQYFRECSGDGVNFGYSTYANGGILAYSRILNETEVLIVGNSSTTTEATVYVEIDANLSRNGEQLSVLFSSWPGVSQTLTVGSCGLRRTVQVTVPAMGAIAIGK